MIRRKFLKLTFTALTAIVSGLWLKVKEHLPFVRANPSKSYPGIIDRIKDEDVNRVGKWGG